MMAREESYYDQTRQSDTLDAWDELRRRNELPTEGPVHQFDRRGVKTVNEDLYGGGPQAFDPRVALELIRNPEGMAQHLASLNREPPPKDFEEGEVMPRDAHMSLGKHLAANYPAGPVPGGFPPTPDVAHSSAPDLPAGQTSQPQEAVPTSEPISGTPGMPQFSAPEAAPPSHPMFRPGSLGDRFFGSGSMFDRAIRGEQIDPGPTVNPNAPPISPPEAAATGTTTAPATQATPGEDRKGVPGAHLAAPNAGTEQFGEESSETPKGLVTSGEPGKPVGGKETPKAAEKEGPLDSFARALMGLKAPQYQNPVHVSSPQAPRPTNLLARSTVPQTLMQEISALGHPAASFRLGEALRGK